MKNRILFGLATTLTVLLVIGSLASRKTPDPEVEINSMNMMEKKVSSLPEKEAIRPTKNDSPLGVQKPKRIDLLRLQIEKLKNGLEESNYVEVVNSPSVGDERKKILLAKLEKLTNKRLEVVRLKVSELSRRMKKIQQKDYIRYTPN